MAKAQQINPEKARWLEVLGIAMPLCLSYVPIGVACGILLHAAGFNFIMTLIVGIAVNDPCTVNFDLRDSFLS